MIDKKPSKTHGEGLQLVIKAYKHSGGKQRRVSSLVNQCCVELLEDWQVGDSPSEYHAAKQTKIRKSPLLPIRPRIPGIG